MTKTAPGLHSAGHCTSPERPAPMRRIAEHHLPDAAVAAGGGA
jgi:hypothetical protein